MTVSSLYMCISYIYAYSYNFYDLSSLHAYCMSISFVTCFMSLTYLLSILLLYSCFYTLHIPILLIFPFYDLSHSMYYYLYLFLDCVYISCLISCNGYTSMLYFSFFIFILVLSYTFILYAFILNFSYTVILYYSYTSYTFVRSYSIIYFMLSSTFCTFLVLV